MSEFTRRDALKIGVGAAALGAGGTLIGGKAENEGWEDRRPKSAVAANVGKGPDVVFGWYDDAHQYPEKLLDLTDLGEYLDKKYGGWYDVAKKFGMRRGRWIALPLGA